MPISTSRENVTMEQEFEISETKLQSPTEEDSTKSDQRREQLRTIFSPSPQRALTMYPAGCGLQTQDKKAQHASENQDTIKDIEAALKAREAKNAKVKEGYTKEDSTSNMIKAWLKKALDEYKTAQGNNIQHTIELSRYAYSNDTVKLKDIHGKHGLWQYIKNCKTGFMASIKQSGTKPSSLLPILLASAHKINSTFDGKAIDMLFKDLPKELSSSTDCNILADNSIGRNARIRLRKWMAGVKPCLEASTPTLKTSNRRASL